MPATTGTSYSYSTHSGRETWVLISLFLLELSLALQIAGLFSPGWHREDRHCGSRGLIYMEYQDPSLVQYPQCQLKAIPATWLETNERAWKLRREYQYGDDIIHGILSILLCGFVFLLDLGMIKLTSRKSTLLGLSIQAIAVANILQWSLVYRYAVINTRENEERLFPYSLLLFGLGTGIVTLVGIFHVYIYITWMKNSKNIRL